jgi:hypothetical protein
MHLYIQGASSNLYLTILRIDVIGIPHHRNTGKLRGKLAEKLQALCGEIGQDKSDSGNVSSRAVETGH